MPQLDRRITLHVEAEGTRDLLSGAYAPGAITDYEVWAERRDSAAELDVSRGLDRTDRSRDYLVRYDARFEVAPSLITVTDEGLTLNVNQVIQDESKMKGRRRFLRIEVVLET